jgi:hypothetical protein
VHLDAAFISGLVAGEGCFSIPEQNGGQSRACRFALALRDDDMELLEAVVSSTGCGLLRAKPAYRTSNPQVVWQVESMADCLALEAFLADSLTLSKKSLEFDVWRRAVQAWTSRRPERRDQMAELAAELKALRDPELAVSWPVDISPPFLHEFLAGFVTGEGHFGTGSAAARFVVNVRSDDRRVLDVLAIGTGLGAVTIEPPTTGSPNPRASWKVNRREEQRELVAILDHHPPRGRKGRTYEIWRDLVLLRRPSVTRLTPAQAAKRTRLSAEVCASIQYRPPTRAVTLEHRKPRTDRIIDALRTWAEACGRPYSVTSYARYRAAHAPALPTRDTVARVFGSWRAALVAAGLPVDDARSPEIVSNIVGTAAPAREQRRAQRRAEILEAIRGCAADLGREPRAMEFFRWRLANAPGSPTQADLYRLFDGGFPAALAAAGDATADTGCPAPARGM